MMKNFYQYIKESRSDYYYRDKRDNMYYNFLSLDKMRREFFDLYGEDYEDPLEDELSTLLLGKNVRFFTHEKLEPCEEKVESLYVYLHNLYDHRGADIYINNKVVSSYFLIRIEFVNPNPVDDPYGEENWD